MTAEVIVFPDIEDVVRLHLGELMNPVQVYAAVTPAELPLESLTITRTGGAEATLVTDESQISIDARSAVSPSRAQRLAEQAAAYLVAAARDGAIHDATCHTVRKLSGPYLNPDPRNPNFHRYSVELSVTLRGFTATP